MLSYAFALSPSLLQQVQQKSLWNIFVTDILLRVKTRWELFVDALLVMIQVVSKVGGGGGCYLYYQDMFIILYAL